MPHPRLRGKWFEEKWGKHKDYVTRAQTSTKTVFERAVLAKDVTNDESATPLIRPRRQPGDEGYDEMIDDIDDSYMYGAGRSARV